MNFMNQWKKSLKPNSPLHCRRGHSSSVFFRVRYAMSYDFGLKIKELSMEDQMIGQGVDPDQENREPGQDRHPDQVKHEAANDMAPPENPKGGQTASPPLTKRFEALEQQLAAMHKLLQGFAAATPAAARKRGGGKSKQRWLSRHRQQQQQLEKEQQQQQQQQQRGRGRGGRPSRGQRGGRGFKRVTIVRNYYGY